MGNACNCVSKENPKEEVNLAGTDKKKKDVKKNEQKQDLDDSNLKDEDGEEMPNLEDPDVVNAALKIQVVYH